MRTNLYGLLLVLATCMLDAQTDPSQRFELIGTYKALGGLMATAGAPGRNKGSERFYGRWIVGGHDGFMYIGIGTAKANIAVFNTNTGELREILPKDAQVVGIAKPYLGVDGKAYANLNDHLFALDGFQIHEMPASQRVAPYNVDVLKNRDGLSLDESGGILTIKNPNTHIERKKKISYLGGNLQVFRAGFGPDGQLYGSSIPPIHFLKVDVQAHRIDQIGALGAGEIYSFLAHDDRLLMGSGVWEYPNFSDRVEISLANHHSVPFDGVIALKLTDLQRIAPKFPGTLLLAAKDAEPPRMLETQIDHDDFLVAVHLKANETQSISLYYSDTLHDHLPVIPRVYANHAYGYNHATVAIESERMGYRTYGGFFFDVQAHGKGELGLINSMLGYASITHPPLEGEDIIHLGDTLGVGGIFLRTGGKVYRPPLSTPDYTHRAPKSDEPSYNVIESGPLRAVVEESLPHWIVGPDIVALRARYEMDANQEIVHCHWWITPTSVSGTYEVGAGILTLSDANNTDADKIVTTAGTQEKTIGNIALGMSYAGTGAEDAVPVETPGGHNQAVLFPGRLTRSQEVSGEYTFAAAWSGSGWDDPAAHVRSVLAQQSEPPTASILAHEINPNPRALEAEPK